MPGKIITVYGGNHKLRKERNAGDKLFSAYLVMLREESERLLSDLDNTWQKWLDDAIAKEITRQVAERLDAGYVDWLQQVLATKKEKRK